MPFDGDFSPHAETEARVAEHSPTTSARDNGGGAMLHPWLWLIRARHIELLRGLDHEQLAMVGLTPLDIARLAARPDVPSAASGTGDSRTRTTVRRSVRNPADT